MMFNEYLNHSNQCTNYYNVIRKEEVNSQKKETNRFKQKWIEISSVYSSNSNASSCQPHSNSLQNNSISTNLAENSNLYNSAAKKNPVQHVSLLEDESQSKQSGQIQYQYQSASLITIGNKQINNQSISSSPASFYTMPTTGPYDQNDQHQQHHSNSINNLTQKNMNSNNNNQIQNGTHYYDAFISNQKLNEFKSSNNHCSSGSFSNSMLHTSHQISNAFHNNFHSVSKISTSCSKNFKNLDSHHAQILNTNQTNQQSLIYQENNLNSTEKSTFGQKNSYNSVIETQADLEIISPDTGIFSRNSSTNSFIHHHPQKSIENILSISNSSKLNNITKNQIQAYSHLNEAKHISLTSKAGNNNMLGESPKNSWSSPVATPSSDSITPPRALMTSLSSSSLNNSLGNAVSTPNSLTSAIDHQTDHFNEQIFDTTKTVINPNKFEANSSDIASSNSYSKSILSEINIDELFVNYPSVFEEIFYSSNHFKFNSIEQIENDLRNFCEHLLKKGTTSNSSNKSNSNQQFSIRI